MRSGKSTDDGRAEAAVGLQQKAISHARIALRRAHAMVRALEQLLEAQGAGEEGEIKRVAKDLHARRRVYEESLLDALELADREVDAMETGQLVGRGPATEGRSSPRMEDTRDIDDRRR